MTPDERITLANLAYYIWSLTRNRVDWQQEPEKTRQSLERAMVQLDKFWWACRGQEPIQAGQTEQTTVKLSLGDWQPIKTAPRDGQYILATIPVNDCQSIVFWNGERWDDGEFGIPWFKPTHWMPLPKSPVLEGAKP